MNMYGIIEPNVPDAPERPSPVRRLGRRLRRSRFFILVVLLPAALLAGYLFGFASDQYYSEAHFLVRTADPQPTPGIGVSQALSSVTGLSSAQGDAMSIADYLTSHDGVRELRRSSRLVERFARADVDFLSRLREADPTPERLLRYYRRQVDVDYNTETGLTTLAVRSFRPADSFELVRDLLRLGEKRVNELNARSYGDALATARRQLGEAEDELARNQVRTTAFRQTRGDIDPQASGEAQIGLVATLTGQLAGARAQLASMNGLISPSSPQYRAVAARVAALGAQVAQQSGRLTGSRSAIAADIGDYEELKLRQQFLAKRYDAAATAVQRAREQALRQQLYVVRVVEPNMPVKSLYPQRWRMFGTALVALLLIYSIGWLLVAGVREHAA
ncbi:lipopolysaccharide biosynthesis protein [uncultured Sphingomonas sp.]|uniref:lipopolysaccharide biosynthesis protein n=1 Tax=uncultured Sphingomonas sp. TaxID=158754 RepID=UPI0035CC5AB1